MSAAAPSLRKTAPSIDYFPKHGCPEDERDYKAGDSQYSIECEYNKHYLNAKRTGWRASAPPALDAGRPSYTRKSTDIAPRDVQRQFELWFPTAYKFKFTYTISYWVAMLSLEGSVLMLFAASASILEPQYPPVCKQMITLVLCMIYLLGCWLQWVQVINVSTTEKRWFWPESWTQGLPELESVVGAIAYFLAMIVWTFGAVYEAFPHEWKDERVETFFSFTSFCGACGFFVGGVCERLHSRHASWSMPVFWVATLDIMGGLHLMAYTACLFFNVAKPFARLNYFLAGLAYTISSALLIVMWQADDFGLALLVNLNDVISSTKIPKETVRPAPADATGSITVQKQVTRAGVLVDRVKSLLAGQSTPKQSKAPLSMRGISFLWVCCYVFAALVVNVVHCMFVGHYKYFLAARDILMMALVVVIVLVHSILPHAPNRQPYRAAVMATRVIFAVASVLYTNAFRHSFAAVML